ncbi:hypothetical protein Tco_0856973 [Tanacetum coccineum]|uniref:Uncharacterized protein n=1 Tax=Tanacetum coccineum TaxID=301880 RepID=A0ABQ5B8T9_9ASTR
MHTLHTTSKSCSNQSKEERKRRRESISYLEAKVKKKEALDSSPKVFRSYLPILTHSSSCFSSITTHDYTPASSDYSLTSPGNTSSDSLEDLSKDLLALLTISPFYNDPYMKVMQAYNATSNESPIPLPRAPIAPPTVLPSSPVLPLSPMFDPQDFFLTEEILPSRKQPVPLHTSSTPAQPQVFEIREKFSI